MVLPHPPIRHAWVAMSLMVGATALEAAPKIDPAAKMADAAARWLATLPPELAEKAVFNYGDGERLNWHFIPRDRKGVALGEMDESQRRLAHALLQAGLSQAGYDKLVNVMRLEEVLREREGPRRNPLGYYLTIFGKPGPASQWGWRFEGHHLSVNFAMRGGKVVGITPAFFGANPANVTDGQYKGLRALAGEEVLARELLKSLMPEQRRVAAPSAKAEKEVAGAGTPQPKLGAPTGLAAGRLSADQKRTLTKLIDAYLANFPAEIADTMRRDLDQVGFNKVHFAWQGSDRPGDAHSYRIQGPTLLIQYVNKLDPVPHIHSYLRSTAGDFGLAAPPKAEVGVR